MTIFSSLLQKNSSFRSMSSHRTFPFGPSRFQWTKFKDMMNFYLILGAVPVGLIVTLSNVFIGPATLQEIPEDYVPKHWEYFRSPITRFIARYIVSGPQEDYEKFMHHIFEEDERRRIRRLEKHIKILMRERMDYQAYYYRPVMAKYFRVGKQAAEYIDQISGD